MHCRCPACGRTTEIPDDLTGFLPRCEKCATLLRLSLRTDQAHSLEIQPVLVGRFQVETARNSGIAELLTPPLSRRIAARPRTTEPPSAAAVIASTVAAGSISPAQGAAALVGASAVESLPADPDLARLSSALRATPLTPPAPPRKPRRRFLGLAVLGAFAVIALGLVAATLAIVKTAGGLAARPAQAKPAEPTLLEDRLPANTDLFPDVPAGQSRDSAKKTR